MNDDNGESKFSPERLRRMAVLFAVFVFLVGMTGLGVNAIWGPKFKRDSLCSAIEEGAPINLKKLTAHARKFDRVPVITIESGDLDDTHYLEPPGPNDPDPPKGLSGNATVNFGTREDRVLCLIRFKNDIVVTVRKNND